MDVGKFEDAILTLENLENNTPFLELIVAGLIGDCYSELQKYDKALTFYDRAGLTHDFNYFTPRNLFKAFEVARELGMNDKANAYLHAIDRYYPVYSELKSIQKYLNPKIDFDPIVINRKYNTISDYENVELGVINGEVIGFEEYMKALDKARMELRTSSASHLPIPTEETFWHQFVQNEVFANAFETLYIASNENDVQDFIFGLNGYPLTPEIANAFRNPQTGDFDSEMLQKQVDILKKSDNAAWEMTMEYYKERCNRFKFTTIIQQGSYITNLSAKNALHEEKDHYEISYTVKSSSDYSDIPVSKKDLETYFEKHEEDNGYRQPFEVKKFQLIYVPLIPSAKDTVQFYLELENLAAQFSESLYDSIFVISHSEESFFSTQIAYTSDINERARLTYPDYMDTDFRSSTVGDVVGPYEDGDYLCLAKVLDKGPLMTARHILIGAPRNDPQAVATAKEKTLQLMQSINSENFTEMVQKYSDDRVPSEPVKNNGTYYNFPEGMMVPEFNDFARDQPLNKIGYVQTTFGFHIMEVLDRKENATCKLAIVKKSLKPSKNTSQECDQLVQEIIKDFKAETKEVDPNELDERIESLAKERELTIRPFTLNVNNPDFSSLRLGDRDSIVKFCLSHSLQEGQFTESPIISNQQYVIPVYTAHNSAGGTSLAYSHEKVKWDYQNELKAQKLIASNTTKTFEKTAEVSLVNPRIDNFPAYEAISEISRSEEGAVLKPIQIDSYVFWIKVNKINVANFSKQDVDNIKMQIAAAERSSFDFLITEALVTRARTINNVSRFLLELYE